MKNLIIGDIERKKKCACFSRFELSYIWHASAFIFELNFFRAIMKKVLVLNVTPGRHLLSLVEMHGRSRGRNKNYHHHTWIPPQNGLSREHFIFALLFLLLHGDRFYRRPFRNTLFPVYDAISQLFFNADVCRFSNLSIFRHWNDSLQISSMIADIINSK